MIDVEVQPHTAIEQLRLRADLEIVRRFLLENQKVFRQRQAFANHDATRPERLAITGIDTEILAEIVRVAGEASPGAVLRFLFARRNQRLGDRAAAKYRRNI